VVVVIAGGATIAGGGAVVVVCVVTVRVTGAGPHPASNANPPMSAAPAIDRKLNLTSVMCDSSD